MRDARCAARPAKPLCQTGTRREIHRSTRDETPVTHRFAHGVPSEFSPTNLNAPDSPINNARFASAAARR